MKEGWKIKSFEDCIEKVSYSNKIKKNRFKESGNFPIISQEVDFINGYWDKEEDLFKLRKPVVIFGDHTKIFKFVDFNFVIGADGIKILETNNQIDPKYFYYYLQSVKLKDLGYARHYRLLKEKKIKFPSVLSEQKRIVSILDKTFEAIEKAKVNAEKNLENSKELFESYLNNIFENKGEDWEESILKYVCELKSGTTISTTLERSEGDVLYVKVADMNLPQNEIKLNTSSRFVNSNEIKKNQIIPEGSVVFPKRGGAIATNKKRKIVKPTIVDLNTMALIPGSKIDSDFFFHWFHLIDLNSISNGTSVPQINNYSFDEVSIPFPKSKVKQQIIAQQLDTLRVKIQNLEEIYKEKIVNLEKMKKSLLKKAFNGEL